MPPKKKARLTSRAASTPSADAGEQATEELQTPLKTDIAKNDLIMDSWTDEQEISLFKGMIRWKPAGMHKHFRMIAISQHLRNHGYTSMRDNHTRIPGIWKKLGDLYNLDALDEREDTTGNGTLEDVEPVEQPFCQFALPEDDYGEMMFAARLAPDGSSSPPSLPYQLSDEGATSAPRQSTIEDTDDPRSSPASGRGQRPSRNIRGSVGRRSQLQEVSIPKGGRRGSKASIDEGTEGGEEESLDQTEGNDDTKGIEKSTGRAAKKRRSGRRR